MAQVPQPPQPPRVPNVAPPRLPRPPGAPPEVGKLGGLFKRRRKDDFLEDDSPDDSQAPAADGSSEQPSGEPAAAEPPPPPSVPYETWAWPSVEPTQQKGKPPVILILALVLLLLAGAGFGVYKLVHKDKTSPAAAKAATPTEKKKRPGTTRTSERAFATSVESILAQSVAQRAKLVQVLAATENGCSIPIAQAKQQVANVAAGRQKLLDRAKGLAAPTQQAAAIKGQLTKALAASLAANQHYTAWVGGLAGAAPCPGSTATNGDYKAAVAASGQATVAKRAFTSAFNPLAKRLGQKTWSPDSI